MLETQTYLIRLNGFRQIAKFDLGTLVCVIRDAEISARD